MPQMPSVWAHRNAQEVTPLQYVEDEVTPLQYADDEVTPLQYAGDTQLPPPTMNELQQDFMHLMEGFQASQESEVENEEDEHSTDDELDISSNSHGLTGYDFAAAVRSWLKAQGKESCSVCEVLLQEGAEGVGLANAFYSHMQETTMVEPGTITRISQACLTFGGSGVQVTPVASRCSTKSFIWLDYFSLRQCMADFELEKINAVVAEIPVTIAEVDHRLTYLTRSFCIYEVIATLRVGHPLNVQTIIPRSRLDHLLVKQPIDARNATARVEADKATIDAFIERSIGFDEMNKMATKAVQDGAQKFRDQRG